MNYCCLSICVCMCWCWSIALIAAEVETPAPTVDIQEQQDAENRADQLMQELEASRADIDSQTRESIAAIDLLTRKAEAYVLVEQPVDAGRMLAEAQALLKTHNKDRRAAVQKTLKTYQQRLLIVAQAVLAHSTAFELGDRKTDTLAPEPQKDQSNDPKQTADDKPSADKE